jgi:CBS domain containing-hemolysin-like protein
LKKETAVGELCVDLRHISATQLGITIASLALGWIGEPAFACAIEHLFGGLPSPFRLVFTHAVAVTLAFLILTFLHIVFGELAPKGLALLHPEATSLWVAGPLIAFTKATNPFIWLLNGTATALLRLFGARQPTAAERAYRPEEILMLVRQSRDSGGLEDQDVRLIEGVFEFSEKTVQDVMTPRTDVVALQSDMPIKEAAQQATDDRRSRYPVIGESLDDIVGIVHVKRLFNAFFHEESGPVSSLTREPLFLPGTREVEDALADMQRRKAHMAVVLDEYGGTAGIVTMEDLVEEIVGEIYDEDDEGEAAPSADNEGLTVPGDTELEDLNEWIRLPTDDEDYRTIGGLVFGHLGRLPRPGDHVDLDQMTLEVVAMDGPRVTKVRFVNVAKRKPPRSDA